MSVITRLIKFLRVGVGISNTDLEYAESTSQTTAPIEGWQTTAPKWRKGYYIWSRTHIYYTDGNEKVSTPMCLSVARSIDRIEECYYSSTSSAAITGGAWAKGKSPAWVSGRYIWTKSIIYFTDGTSTETTPICCTGGQGPQGKPGENGMDGADGAAGKDAINIQLSMLSIVHKKSQFVGSYSIDVQAFRAGEEITCGCSCYVSSDTTTGISIREVKYKMGRRILITIEKNAIVNDTLVVEVSADKTDFIYKIPFRTVEDGEPGAKGEVGATLRGPQSWDNCGVGYDFQCGASGEEWKDVVIYNSGFYSCIKSHIKSETNFPGSDEDQNNHYWRLGSPIEMVIAKIILTQYQLVDNLGVKVIEMKDENDNIMFLAKDGKVICNGGIFQNISVSGDISVGRLRYNENTVTDGTSVINGSFIRGGGTYVLPHLSDGEFMRIVVFNPIITRSTPLATLKGEQEMDAFMAAGSSFFLNREATIGVYGWCELIGTSQNGHTIWVYSVVENKQN
nr:MAG TPA: tail protein [Caudoviricetes sp.]